MKKADTNVSAFSLFFFGKMGTKIPMGARRTTTSARIAFLLFLPDGKEDHQGDQKSKRYQYNKVSHNILHYFLTFSGI